MAPKKIIIPGAYGFLGVRGAKSFFQSPLPDSAPSIAPSLIKTLTIFAGPTHYVEFLFDSFGAADNVVTLFSAQETLRDIITSADTFFTTAPNLYTEALSDNIASLDSLNSIFTAHESLNDTV